MCVIKQWTFSSYYFNLIDLNTSNSNVWFCFMTHNLISFIYIEFSLLLKDERKKVLKIFLEQLCNNTKSEHITYFFDRKKEFFINYKSKIFIQNYKIKIIVQRRIITKIFDSNSYYFKNSNINIHVFIILNRKKNICVFISSGKIQYSE